jgi:hypothetical protein
MQSRANRGDYSLTAVSFRPKAPQPRLIRFAHTACILLPPSTTVSTSGCKLQVIAWSDPNDLLSWDVPTIEGADVVNIHVRNSGFKIVPFLVSPNGAHANYAKNKKILSRIFKPNPKP